MSALIASAGISSGPGALRVFRRLIAFLISSLPGLSQLTSKRLLLPFRCLVDYLVLVDLTALQSDLSISPFGLLHWSELPHFVFYMPL